MIAAGVIAIFLGVNAERRSLEDIARPFTAARDRLAGQPKAPAVRARWWKLPDLLGIILSFSGCTVRTLRDLALDL